MAISIQFDLNNTTVSPNDLFDLENNTEYTFTVTANEGYIFNILPTLMFKGRPITPTKISDYEYSFTFTTYEDGVYYLTAYASVEDLIKNKYGVLQTYKISRSEMEDFLNETFVNTSLGAIDLSKWVASMKYLFINAENTERDNIIVERINTGIETDKCLNDYVSFDLGYVILNGLYHNELDKKYSEITVKLPYIGDINIDSNFMNEKIHIKLTVHLISGECTAFIFYVDNNDNEYLIADKDGVLGFDFPFSSTFETLDMNFKNVNVKYNTFKTPPKIIVKEKLKSTKPIYNTDKYTLIADEEGYFQTDFIDIKNINATATEKEMIESLLKSGVFI